MKNKVHNKGKKLYEVMMTSIEGTYSAGAFYGRNRRESCIKAEKFNGDNWTYYIGNYKYISKKNKEYWEMIDKIGKSLAKNPKAIKIMNQLKKKFDQGKL